MELNRDQIIKAFECCADDFVTAIEENKKLTEENAKLARSCTELTQRCTDLARICESYVLQYGTATDKEVFLKKERADTVRKMKEIIAANYAVSKVHYVKDEAPTTTYQLTNWQLDKIANELLEGEGK